MSVSSPGLIFFEHNMSNFYNYLGNMYNNIHGLFQIIQRTLQSSLVYLLLFPAILYAENDSTKNPQSLIIEESEYPKTDLFLMNRENPWIGFVEQNQNDKPVLIPWHTQNPEDLILAVYYDESGFMSKMTIYRIKNVYHDETYTIKNGQYRRSYEKFIEIYEDSVTKMDFTR